MLQFLFEADARRDTTADSVVVREEGIVGQEGGGFISSVEDVVGDSTREFILCRQEKPLCRDEDMEQGRGGGGKS